MAFEAALARHAPPRWSPLRDAAVEDFELPSLADLFDEFTAAHGYPPSQDDFVARVAEGCAERFPSYLDATTWTAVEARIRRAHPSFVRERHLQILLEGERTPCFRSPALDQQHATDLVVMDGRLAVRLVTFVDTPRARREWERKQARLRDRGLYLVVPLFRSQCRELNGYWLYTTAYVAAIRDRLLSIGASPDGCYFLTPDDI